MPELIELAAASNPETRIVWQRARQAALAIGVANSSYWPTLSAIALGAYQHSSFSASSLASGLNLVAYGVLPGIQLSRRAADWNERARRGGHVPGSSLRGLEMAGPGFLARSDSEGAEQTSVAANMLFVGEHQKLLFQVSKAYFGLGAARAQVRVAQDALERTRTIARSAEARFGRGLATTVEVAEGRREVAQAEYGLTEARAAETMAGHCSPRWEWTRELQWTSTRPPVARWWSRSGSRSTRI